MTYIKNNKNNESRLLYEIMRELGKYGAVFRTNSGSIKLPDGRRFNGLPKGFSDVLAILPGGRAAFIEVKAAKGKVSKEQITFLEKMRAQGALAGVACTVPQALAICGLDDKVRGDI